MRHLIVLAVVAFVGCSLVQGIPVPDTKVALIVKGNDLVKRADEAIKKLEKEHKTQEVTLLKKEEADIQKLIKELEAADPTKLAHIEHDLAIAEAKLIFALSKLNPGHHDVLKEVLLQRAKTLEKQAEEAIKKLKAEKKDQEVSVLEKEEALIKKLVKELEEAKTSADVRHIEFELSAAERKLSYELRKIHQHGHNPQDLLKKHLIERATALEKLADEEIKKLKAEKKDTAVLEKDEALVKELVKKLETATAADLTHIERDLMGAEARLALELRKGHGSHDFVKETLLKKAAILEKEAEAAIKTLKAEKKDAEAAVVEKEETAIKELVKKLQAAKAHDEIQKLEKELTVAEAKLFAELKKVHPAHPKLVRRDVKDDLIKHGNDLLKKADEAIKKLQAQHNTVELNKVLAEEAEIKKLIAELEAAKDATKIHHLEHDLKIAESRLSYELRKIEHPAPHHPDLKEILLNRAKTLEKQAVAIEAKLKADHKDAEATVIADELAQVQKLVKDLTGSKTAAEVQHLEKELQTAEYKLSYQLRKIYDEEFKEELRKKTLLRRAYSLEKYAEAAIAKLKALKKDAEVAEVTKEETQLKALVKSLEAAKTLDDIHKLEKELLAAEDKLYAELRKVNALIHDHNTHVDPKDKPILLKKAADLQKQATEAITTLKAQKKDAEVAIIEKEEKVVQKLVAELNAAKTDAEVLAIEKKLAAAEATLTTELKKALPHKVRRDVKEDLLAKSTTLLNTARTAIEKLKAEGKHELAAGIEHIEKFLIDIDSQVRNFHPHTILGQHAQHLLEKLLHDGETMLEDALKKLNH